MLKPAADGLFALAMAVPMSVVRLIFLGVFALLALWVLILPPQLPENGRQEVFSDLRVFALIVLIVQSLFYIIF